MAYLDCVRTVAVLALGVVSSGILACAPSPTASKAQSVDCDRKAEQDSLDEGCALEIAKAEILTRVKDAKYENFKVRFDKDRRSWIVMAYNENGPPDSHTYLEISANGQVVGIGNRQ